MPNRNGQGPENGGPMTGRGRGKCGTGRQSVPAGQQPDESNAPQGANGSGCRGPMGCGTGRRGGGNGGGMKGRGRQS